MAAGEERFSSGMEPLVRCPCWSPYNRKGAGGASEREVSRQKGTKRATWVKMTKNTLLIHDSHSKIQCIQLLCPDFKFFQSRPWHGNAHYWSQDSGDRGRWNLWQGQPGSQPAPGQPELHSEALSEKEQRKKLKKKFFSQMIGCTKWRANNSCVFI